MSPPAFQRAERIARRAPMETFVPSPDATLGDGDGAARHPYLDDPRLNKLYLIIHRNALTPSRQPAFFPSA